MKTLPSAFRLPPQRLVEERWLEADDAFDEITLGVRSRLELSTMLGVDEAGVEENTDDRCQPFRDPHSKMHVDLDDSCE